MAPLRRQIVCAFALTLAALPIAPGASAATEAPTVFPKSAADCARGPQPRLRAAGADLLRADFDQRRPLAGWRTRGAAVARSQPRVANRSLRVRPRSWAERRLPAAQALTVTVCMRPSRAGAGPVLELTGNRLAIVATRLGSLRAAVRGRARGRALKLRRGRWSMVQLAVGADGSAMLSVNGAAPVRVSAGARDAKVLRVGGKAQRGLFFVDDVVVTRYAGDSAGDSATPGSGDPAETAGGGSGERPFAADSFWNAALPDDAALDQQSDAYVRDLQRQLGIAAPWINTTQYSTPVYRVAADQPTVRVRLATTYEPELQRAFAAVPIPADARVSGGTDQHMVVWQPSTDTMWEFWLAQKKLFPPQDWTDNAVIDGGTLADGVYDYAVSAINAGGETELRGLGKATVAGGKRTVRVRWEHAPGATGYNVYRKPHGAPGGDYRRVGSLPGAASGVHVMVDDGSSQPGDGPPAANTATTGEWHARWGGRMTNVSRSPGYFDAPSHWGATATSLPLMGGLIRPDELRRGRIDHALAMAIPEPRREWFSWPAQRTDGWIGGAAAIPEGARFRLDPRLDVASLGLPRATRIIAEAAQRYGIVVRDKAGAVVLYAEDPASIGSNPYPELFANQAPDRVMRAFPWSRLQALKTDQHCCWRR